jgi:conjugal transfer pilus assembly protein TraK
MFKKLRVVFVLGLFFSMPSLAMETKWMADNQTRLVKISSKDITRIFVADDRIRAVKGQENAYTIKSDLSTGQIFIAPTVDHQHIPFSLFITTEQGRNYTLFAVPIDVPGQVIEIKPLSPVKKIAEHWEKSGPFTERIIALIHAMAHHEAPNGYVIHPENFKRHTKNTLITLQESYRGNHFRGDVLSIKNTSAKTILLNETDFYQTRVIAIAFPLQKLAPNNSTLIYRISSND